MKTSHPSRTLATELKHRRRILITATLLRGVLQWLSISFAVCLALFLLDNLLALPGGLRLFLDILGAAGVAYTLFRAVLRPVLRYRSLERFARHLESIHGIPRNLLVNAVQLQRQSQGEPTATFIRRIVHDATRKVRTLSLRPLVRPLRLQRWGLIAVLLGVAWIGYAIAAPAGLRNAALRFRHPLSDVLATGRIRLHVIPSADLAVLPGEDLTIFTVIETDAAADPATLPIRHNARPYIALRPGRERIPDRAWIEGSLRMAPLEADSLSRMPLGGNGLPFGDGGSGSPAARNEWLTSPSTTVFSHHVPHIQGEFSFRVFAPGARIAGDSIRVGVTRPPGIVVSQFLVTPPTYTGLRPRVSPGAPHPLSGLPGSDVRIELSLDAPVVELTWQTEAGRLPLHRDPASGHWHGETRIDAPGTYTLAARIEGVSSPYPLARGNILLRDDLPPQVAIAGHEPRRERVAGDELQLDLVAVDDLGLSELGVVMRPAGTDHTERIHTWTFEPPPGVTGTLSRSVSIPLRPSIFPPGGAYIVEAVGRDFNPRNPEVRSAPILVHVEMPRGQPVSDIDPALQSAHTALHRAIRAQVRALEVSRTLHDYLDDLLAAQREEYRAAGGYLRHHLVLQERQEEVAEHLTEGIAAARNIAAASSPLADILLTLRTYPVQQALSQISSLGALQHWIEPDQQPVARGTFAQTQTLQTVRFTQIRGRYAALQGITSHGTATVSVAELDFLDAEGMPFARAALRDWHVSATTNVLTPDDVFPSLQRGDVMQHLASALQSERRQANGPRVEPASLRGKEPRTGVAYYLAREILTQDPRRVLLRCRRHGGLRVWLNEWLVEEAPPVPHGDTAISTTPLDLETGRNTVLLEVSSATEIPAVEVRVLNSLHEALALSATGHLLPAPHWRVVHADPCTNESEPRHVVDQDITTSWIVPGVRPSAVIVDLGAPQSITGFRYASHPARPETGIFEYAFTMADHLAPERHLPPRLKTLIRLQRLILDRLTALRGKELARGESTPVPGERPQPASLPPEDAGGMPPPERERRVAAYLDDVSRFAAESQALSEERGQLLRQLDATAPAELAPLEEVKRREMENASRLADAVSEVNQKEPADAPIEEPEDVWEKLLEDSRQLSGLADRKAGLPPAEETDMLDRQISRLCDQIQASGRDVLNSSTARAAASGDTRPKRRPSPADADADTEAPAPGETASEIDRRQQALRDDIEAIEHSVTRHGFQRGEAAPGDVISHGKGSRAGRADATQRTDAGSEAEMGASGPADGRATGGGSDDRQAPAGQAAVPGEPEPARMPPGAAGGTGSIDDPSGAEARGTGTGTHLGAADTTGEALSLPASLPDKVEAVYAEQRRIRETARRMLNDLTDRNVPASSLRSAVGAMSRVEEALFSTNAAALRQAYDEAARWTARARHDIQAQRGMHSVVPSAPTHPRDDVRHVRERAAPPDGYRTMVRAYFRRLAEEAPGESP